MKPSLSTVVTQSRPLRDRIVLFGPPGWGKTSFATRFPKAIYLMTPGEDRLVKLIEQGLVPPTAHFPEVVETWDEAMAGIEELATGTHKHETLVIDTGNGLERLGHERIGRTRFSADGEIDWGEHGFNGYGRGEKITANELWQPLLVRLDRLRAKRGMRIVLLCHAGTHSQRNPDRPDFDKIAPLSKSAWAFTSKWADMILRGDFEIAFRKDDPKSKIGKAKAQGGEVRLLYTSGTAAFDAKNCHLLPPVIRLGTDPLKAFDVFRSAFPRQARNGTTTRSGQETEGIANGADERTMGEGEKASVATGIATS